MIDFSTLKLGDAVYTIETRLNAMQQRKIFKVDEDGVEWFRYNKPLRTYTIQSFIYVGCVEPRVVGKVIVDDVDEVKYFIEDQQGEMAYLNAGDANSDWFYSQEEASQEMMRRIADDQRIDRS